MMVKIAIQPQGRDDEVVVVDLRWQPEVRLPASSLPAGRYRVDEVVWETGVLLPDAATLIVRKAR